MTDDRRATRQGGQGQWSSPAVVGVLAKWVSGWAEVTDVVGGRFLDIIESVGGYSDRATERMRGSLVVDWLIRAAAPRWLRAVGLADHARALRGLEAIGSPQALSVAAPVVEAAGAAAHRAHEEAWYGLASRAHPDASDPGRAPVWLAVVEGTRAAAEVVWIALEPAGRASGYRTGPQGGGPVAWSAAVGAVNDCAAALCWAAARSLTTGAGWSWALPPEQARALAYCAGRAALAGVDAATQAAMAELLAAMLTLPAPERREPS